MTETSWIIYIIRVIMLSFFCGITEGLIIAVSGTTGDKILAGHFSVYHVFLLPFFLLFGLQYFENNTLLTLYSMLMYLPVIIVTQDIISHKTKTIKTHTPFVFGGWHKWPLQKLWWFKVPYFYWLCLFAQAFLVLLYVGVKAIGKQ